MSIQNSNQNDPENKISEISNTEQKTQKYVRVPVYTKKHYGSPLPANNKKSYNMDNIGGLITVAFFFSLLIGLPAVVGLFNIIKEANPTPEEKAQKARIKLDEWYTNTSQYNCESTLEKKLRDPKSYEKIGNFTTPTDNGKEKIITWEFRSKNGFGGYTPGIGMCFVSKENGGSIKTKITN